MPIINIKSSAALDRIKALIAAKQKAKDDYNEILSKVFDVSNSSPSSILASQPDIRHSTVGVVGDDGLSSSSQSGRSAQDVAPWEDIQESGSAKRPEEVSSKPNSEFNLGIKSDYNSEANITNVSTGAVFTLAAKPASNFNPNSKEIIYNTEQNRAITLATSGKSFALTGPAGSGKTTTVQGIISALIESGRCGIFKAVSHKHLPAQGVPGIVVTGYTNKAVSNAKKHLSSELQANCVTIHKLLEYEPEYVEIPSAPGDINSGTKTSMRFVPHRTEANPNPVEITTLIIEESSMVAVDLWNRLIESFPAITHSHLQVIFIGDIQQLPPVFGKSIYIHAMSRGMETVELTHVYRQALESPIIALAHRVLSGKQIPAKELPEFNIDKLSTGQGKVFIHVRKHKIGDMAAVKQMSLWIPDQIDKGAYDPAEDVILTPYNVNFGTEELNKIVAAKYASLTQSPIYEIFTGISKVYYRVGERVLFHKSEAIIKDIKVNKGYYGKLPRLPSATMDYAGVEHDRTKYLNGDAISAAHEEEIFDYVDSMMNAMADHTSEDNPTSRAASHVITVESADTGVVSHIRTSGEVAALSLGYAITVHKAQGSEYRRVFFITHHSQATMLYRELIYTAITRAKEELYIICEPNMFVKGINSQRYPGRTIAEKIASFDRAQRLVLNNGVGNKDQLPKDLHRFIEDQEILETEEELQS